MATRLKTVEFHFPMITSLITDATDTNFTQITAYLPESSKNFVSVTLKVIAHDKSTTVTNTSRRQISLQLGAAGYTAVNNVQPISQTGEQMTIQMTANLTSYFNTNWSGSSMTVDARMLFDGGAVGWTNATAKLTITYEYDDTSATHVKTVCIPLDAPVTTLETAKPGSPTATIPALDTYLPEASKTIREMVIVVQGNTTTSGTTDHQVDIEIDSAGVQSTNTFEAGANSDMWTVLNFPVTFTTNAAHDFYIWGGASGKFNHPQIWLQVTYEFDPAATTTVMNSLWLLSDTTSPMGGTTSADAQRFRREIMIQEPATITTERMAFYMHWQNSSGIAGLNMRFGTGSYVTYTDSATNTAGGVAAMIRNDSAFTLARGRNVLTVDVYRTDTLDLGLNLSGRFLINYTSGKRTEGVGAHAHTVVLNIMAHDTNTAQYAAYSAAFAPSIPEANYYLSAVGVNCEYQTTSSSAAAGIAVSAERLTTDNEDGTGWEAAYVDIAATDAEVGIFNIFAQCKDIFRRWPGDPEARRLGFENSRRWCIAVANNSLSFFNLDLVFTYHSIPFTVADSISDSDGGTVAIELHRSDSGEKVLETTRVGDGAFSFTWYDNTEDMYVTALDASGNGGRSADGLAV